MAQQQISVVTLGVDDLARSKRFYADGFGWTTVFESDEIAFFQMNGLMLGLWLKPKLQEDMRKDADGNFHAFSIAHNVDRPDAVDALLARLSDHGGTILRSGDAPPHGGYRGYIACADNHIWEIAYNPAWPINNAGHVTFGV